MNLRRLALGSLLFLFLLPACGGGDDDGAGGAGGKGGSGGDPGSGGSDPRVERDTSGYDGLLLWTKGSGFGVMGWDLAGSRLAVSEEVPFDGSDRLGQPRASADRSTIALVAYEEIAEGKLLGSVRGVGLGAGGGWRYRTDDLKPNQHRLTQQPWLDSTGNLVAVAESTITKEWNEDLGMDLYFESPLSIEVWDRSGNQRIRVTEGDSSHSSPMLTADGKTVFFLSDRDGEVDLYRAEVKEGADVERLDALAATGVEAIAGTAGGPQISGDGRWLVFVGALGGQRTGAFLLDTPAGGFTRLDSGEGSNEGSVENVSISHDGSTLSWTAGCTPTCSGWIRPTVGGTPHLVVEDVFLTSPLALSPDGSQIAYLSNEGVLLVMRGDGSDPRVVTSADEERNIATVMLFQLGFS
jgi:hypothetical protein